MDLSQPGQVMNYIKLAEASAVSDMRRRQMTHANKEERLIAFGYGLSHSTHATAKPECMARPWEIYALIDLATNFVHTWKGDDATRADAVDAWSRHHLFYEEVPAIARDQGRNENTVKVSVHRINYRIRKALGQEYEDLARA